MRGQADPWELTVLLESLKTHWIVSCNGGRRDEKGGISRNKDGVPPIQPGGSARLCFTNPGIYYFTVTPEGALTMGSQPALGTIIVQTN